MEVVVDHQRGKAQRRGGLSHGQERQRGRPVRRQVVVRVNDVEARCLGPTGLLSQLIDRSIASLIAESERTHGASYPWPSRPKPARAPSTVAVASAA